MGPVFPFGVHTGAQQRAMEQKMTNETKRKQPELTLLKNPTLPDLYRLIERL